MQVVCVFCAKITSGTSQSVHTYLCTSCAFFPIVLAPPQRSHLWSCFTVHSSGFSRGKLPQAHLPSASHFHVFFSFNSTVRFAILSFFIPLRFPPCLFTFASPNDPINARAPSLGPRLSLFSEVSYGAFSHDVIAAVWCSKTMKRRSCWCIKTILWGLNSFLMSMM